MGSNVEHVLIGHLYFFCEVSSFRVPIFSKGPFKEGLIYLSSLYILGVSPLSEEWLPKVFFTIL